MLQLLLYMAYVFQIYLSIKQSKGVCVTYLILYYYSSNVFPSLQQTLTTPTAVFIDIY